MRKEKASAGEFFTATADTGPLRNVVNATGVVQTVVTVQVGSQVSGQVEELYADYNSVVKQGASCWRNSIPVAFKRSSKIRRQASPLLKHG